MIFLRKDNLKNFDIKLKEDDKNPNFFHIYKKGSEITTLDLTNLDIFEIGKECFKKCLYLEKVILPSQVKIIEESAFESCISLQEVVFPENLEIIEQNAFAYCNLKSFHAPKSLTYIGSGAFMQNRLKDVSLNDNLETIDDWAFSDNHIEEIFVPSSVVNLKFSFIDNQLIEEKTKLFLPPHFNKPVTKKPTTQTYNSLDEVIEEAKSLKQINNYIKTSLGLEK